MDIQVKTVKCQVHGDVISVEHALVPAVADIMKETGRPVTPATLLDRAVCTGSRRVLRGVWLYPYLDTVERLVRHGEEWRAAEAFASRYRSARRHEPKPAVAPKSRPATVYVGGEEAAPAADCPSVVVRK